MQRIFRSSVKIAHFSASQRVAGFSSSASAGNVKKLRELTGGAIKDCRKALVAIVDEHGEGLGEDDLFEKAQEWLRKKGLSSAAKRAGNETREGLVGLAFDRQNNRAALLELNCETDFVSRNTIFRDLVAKLIPACLQIPGSSISQDLNIDELSEVRLDGTSVSDELNSAYLALREKIHISKAAQFNLSAEQGANGYMHNHVEGGLQENLLVGRQSSLVILGADAPWTDQAQFLDISARLAMHSVAKAPAYLNRQGVPQEVFDKEREILLAEAKESGKIKEGLMERVIEGKMNKFFKERCFVNQDFFVPEDAKTVAEYLSKGQNALGVNKFDLLVARRNEVGRDTVDMQ